MTLDYVIPLNLVLLLLTFYTLCIICDEYLVPAVEVFIKQFKVPEEVAAVTLVAFGSAAPELFLNSISAIRHTSDLSLSAILGSGLIAFGLIPPLCFLSIHHEEVYLKLSPILRECGFYIIGLTMFLLSMNDGKISTNEAFITVTVYLFYVGLVIYMYLGSASGLKVIAKLQQKMLNSNTLMNNTGTAHEQHITTTCSSGKHTVNRELYPDLEQQQSHLILDNDSESENESEDEEMQSIPLLNPSDNGVESNGDETLRDNDDVEEAVSPSMRTNSCERTIALINHCIACPIQFVLSMILPQLHPTATTTVPTIDTTITDVETVDLLAPYTSSSPYVTPNSSSKLLTDNNSCSNNTSSSRCSTPLTTTPVVIRSPRANKKKALSKEELVPLWRAITVLFVSIVCIGVLASGIVSFSETIVRHLGIDTSTLGATLVALGAEIPDTISSISLARSGYYDGAIAGAIGSQVINISLGVGLPALFVCLTGDGYLTIAKNQVDSLWLLTCLLFIVILSYVTVTIPVVVMCTQRLIPELTSVGKTGAVIQIFVWCSVYAVFIWNNESTR